MKRLILIIISLLGVWAANAQIPNEDIVKVESDLKVTYGLYSFVMEGEDIEYKAINNCKWSLLYVYDKYREIGDVYVGIFGPDGELVSSYTYENKELVKLSKNGYHCLVVGDGYSICFQAMEFDYGWTLNLNAVLL